MDSTGCSLTTTLTKKHTKVQCFGNHDYILKQSNQTLPKGRIGYSKDWENYIGEIQCFTLQF